MKSEMVICFMSVQSTAALPRYSYCKYQDGGDCYAAGTGS